MIYGNGGIIEFIIIGFQFFIILVLLLRNIEDILREISENQKFIHKIREFINQFSKKVSICKSKDFIQNIEILNEARRRFLQQPEVYIDTACESIENNHGECYYASDSKEALDIILTIIGESKDVILSNGPELREIDLPELLRKNNIHVFFTKISDIIGDIIGLRYPSEYNVKFYDDDYVMRAISKYFNKEFEKIEDMLDDLRNYLKNVYQRVEIGISSVDAIAADTGSIFVMDVEGEIRRISGAPRTHILISGIEKIYPTFLDAWVATYLKLSLSLARKPTNINIISGPSKTADIEKVTTYGAHGPNKLFVIFLDNKRKKFFLDADFSKFLSCIECSGCIFRQPLLTAFTGNISYPVENVKELLLRIANDDPSLNHEKVKGLLGSIIKRGDGFECPVGIDFNEVISQLGLKEEVLESSIVKALESFMRKLEESNDA